MKKILIIRFSSIGDIVLTTPVLRCLKKKFPNAELHFCTKLQYANLLDSNPFISKVHTLNHSLKELIEHLKTEKYDAVVDLHNNIRTLRIKLTLGIKFYTFKKLNFRKWLLTKLKINKLPSTHIVDRYMNSVSSIGVEYDGEGLDFFIPISQEILPKEISFKENTYIVYAIGAQHATKKLPIAKAVEMLNLIELPIVLIGGNEDIETAEKIIALLEHKTIVHGCGKWTIMQSAMVCKYAKLIISHDTGMMHISAALNKPVISIWGNTIPEFGMYPFYKTAEKFKNLKMFEIKDLQCRPCSKIGFNQCPKGHFNCMNKQDFSSIQSLLD